jgi:hypothetical protein
LDLLSNKLKSWLDVLLLESWFVKVEERLCCSVVALCLQPNAKGVQTGQLVAVLNKDLSATTRQGAATNEELDPHDDMIGEE